MNLLFRLLWLRLTVGRKSRLGFRDVDRLPMRARWTDLDQLRHVNNGVFLSMMDLGRVDLMMRTGVWKKLMDAAYYPVVASQTITYRKSLQWRQRFVLETRMAGFHEKALFVEQRFVVDGEIFAQAFVKARFLKRSGGHRPGRGPQRARGRRPDADPAGGLGAALGRQLRPAVDARRGAERVACRLVAAVGRSA